MVGSPQAPKLRSWHAESLDDLTTLNVTFDNFPGIFEVAHLVPDSFRVDHNAGPKLASVQTACNVGTNLTAQTQASNLLFEELPKGFRTFFAAASFGVSFGSAVGTDKEMVLVGPHIRFLT